MNSNVLQICNDWFSENFFCNDYVEAKFNNIWYKSQIKSIALQSCKPTYVILEKIKNKETFFLKIDSFKVSTIKYDITAKNGYFC